MRVYTCVSVFCVCIRVNGCVIRVLGFFSFFWVKVDEYLAGIGRGGRRNRDVVRDGVLEGGS